MLNIYLNSRLEKAFNLEQKFKGARRRAQEQLKVKIKDMGEHANTYASCEKMVWIFEGVSEKCNEQGRDSFQYFLVHISKRSKK